MISDVRVLVVMGVTGSGKTTVGRALANALGWPFLEGDEFHSAANVAKMARGEGLTDDDRRPWLAALRARLEQEVEAGHCVVLACSALRAWYRAALAPRNAPDTATRFVFLDVPESVLVERLQHRRGHYAHADLLPSQFATLEPPANAIRVDGTRPVEEIVRTIEHAIGAA